MKKTTQLTKSTKAVAASKWKESYWFNCLGSSCWPGGGMAKEIKVESPTIWVRMEQSGTVNYFRTVLKNKETGKIYTYNAGGKFRISKGKYIHHAESQILLPPPGNNNSTIVSIVRFKGKN